MKNKISLLQFSASFALISVVIFCSIQLSFGEYVGHIYTGQVKNDMTQELLDDAQKALVPSSSASSEVLSSSASPEVLSSSPSPISVASTPPSSSIGSTFSQTTDSGIQLPNLSNNENGGEHKKNTYQKVLVFLMGLLTILLETLMTAVYSHAYLNKHNTATPSNDTPSAWKLDTDTSNNIPESISPTDTQTDPQTNTQTDTSPENATPPATNPPQNPPVSKPVTAPAFSTRTPSKPTPNSSDFSKQFQQLLPYILDAYTSGSSPSAGYNLSEGRDFGTGTWWVPYPADSSTIASAKAYTGGSSGFYGESLAYSNGQMYQNTYIPINRKSTESNPAKPPSYSPEDDLAAAFLGIQ